MFATSIKSVGFNTQQQLQALAKLQEHSSIFRQVPSAQQRSLAAMPEAATAAPADSYLSGPQKQNRPGWQQQQQQQRHYRQQR